MDVPTRSKILRFDKIATFFFQNNFLNVMNLLLRLLELRLLPSLSHGEWCDWRTQNREFPLPFFMKKSYFTKKIPSHQLKCHRESLNYVSCLEEKNERMILIHFRLFLCSVLDYSRQLSQSFFLSAPLKPGWINNTFSAWRIHTSCKIRGKKMRENLTILQRSIGKK